MKKISLDCRVVEITEKNSDNGHFWTVKLKPDFIPMDDIEDTTTSIKFNEDPGEDFRKDTIFNMTIHPANRKLDEFKKK